LRTSSSSVALVIEVLNLSGGWDVLCKQVVPELESGKNIMIAAHGNSLRAIIMYLDKLTPKEVIELELSTGIPMLYTLEDAEFLRRGSPVGPTVQGVYALTQVRTTSGS
jgi:2,3-bisphosphoglycerate-dependent phosphoglycerate mutase